MQNTQENKSNV